MVFTKNNIAYAWTSSDIAETFQFTPEHVRRLTRGNKIPHVKIGRQYWYNLQEVTNVLVTVRSADKKEVDDLLEGL